MSRQPAGRAALAAAACALSLFIFVHALIGAVRIDLEEGSRSPDAPAADTAATYGPDLDREALLLAADSDPFQPDRQRPAFRYRLPGDVEPTSEPPPPPPQTPDFRLRGTSLSAAGSAALIQVGDAQPRMVEVGDHLLGFRLESVAPTSAHMTGPTGPLTLIMPAPPQHVAAQPESPEPGRSQRGRNVRERAQIQQMLQRARDAGATPQMLEALMRAIEQRGIEGIENVEFGPNGSMMIRRNRPPAADTAAAARTPEPR